MPFARYVPVWSGFPGAPGYTVLNFNGVPGTPEGNFVAQAVADFFGVIAGLIPTNATITYPGEMTLHDNTGQLTGAIAVTPPTATDCTGIGAYSAPTGARVQWETGTIVGGRRLRGRSFIVPLVGTQYDTTGTIVTAALNTLSLAANDLVADTTTTGHPIAVWSQTTSTVAPVTAAVIPDQATVLRSRRD